MKEPVRKMLSTGVLVLAAFGAGNAFAVALTGEAAADGWTLIGNSRDTSPVIYARGGTQDFNAYVTSFTLAAGDSFSGSGFQGSAGGALVGGSSSWLAGDRILGLGISSTNNLNSSFVKIDFGGTGTWAPAPTLDGAGGVGSFTAGGPGSIIAQSIQSGATYTPNGNAYKDMTGTQQTALNFNAALRAWAILGSDGVNYNSMEWLVNYDELLRLSMPVPAIGSSSRFVVNASGPVPGQPAGTNNDADVAFSFALAFPTAGGTVPEPGSLALVALALIGLGVARRRA